MKKFLLFLLAALLLVTGLPAMAATDSSGAIDTGLKLWMELDGDLYVKNETSRTMKYVWLEFATDNSVGGPEWLPAKDEFSLAAGEARRVKTGEAIDGYVSSSTTESLRFVAKQSATHAGADWIAGSNIITYRPFSAVVGASPDMPVYAAAKAGAKKIATVGRGDKVTVLNWKGGWARISAGGKIGYAQIKYLAAENGIAAVVNADAVIQVFDGSKLRESSVSRGTSVELVGKSGSYFLIRSASGKYAYILKKNLSPAD